MVILLKTRSHPHLLAFLGHMIILNRLNAARNIDVPDVCLVATRYGIDMSRRPRIGKPAPGTVTGNDEIRSMRSGSPLRFLLDFVI